MLVRLLTNAASGCFRGLLLLQLPALRGSTPISANLQSIMVRDNTQSRVQRAAAGREPLLGALWVVLHYRPFQVAGFLGAVLHTRPAVSSAGADIPPRVSEVVSCVVARFTPWL